MHMRLAVPSSLPRAPLAGPCPAAAASRPCCTARSTQWPRRKAGAAPRRTPSGPCRRLRPPATRRVQRAWLAGKAQTARAARPAGVPPGLGGHGGRRGFRACTTWLQARCPHVAHAGAPLLHRNMCPLQSERPHTCNGTMQRGLQLGRVTRRAFTAIRNRNNNA